MADEIEGEVAYDTLGFIIGRHVIEHSKNPIDSIVTALKKLKVGGKLLLVVPDKHRTFDKVRAITSLDHVIKDFENHDRQDDYEHYFDYYGLVVGVPEEELAQMATLRFEEEADLHFHVWDYNAFLKMIAYVKENLVDFGKIFSHPAMPDLDNDIEFYVLIEK